MLFLSKFILIGLSFFSISDCFILQSYKLVKPTKLSRSNTPIYLLAKNNNSFFNFINDDGLSTNSSLIFDNDKKNKSNIYKINFDDNDYDFYNKPKYPFGLTEYDIIFLKIFIISLINAYLIAICAEFTLKLYHFI